MADDDPSAPRRDVASATSPAGGPAARLVPYLDLFARLDDEELARLTEVDPATIAGMRRQIQDVSARLSEWADLLVRLDDDQLARLTGVAAKTIRFWRLCQPRASGTRPASQPASPSRTVTRGVPTVVAPRPGGVPIASIRPSSRATVAAPVRPPPAKPQPPVADWSGDDANVDTSITSIRSIEEVAQWDTTSPIAGTATMITPIEQRPDTTWQRRPTPPTIDPLDTIDGDIDDRLPEGES